MGAIRSLTQRVHDLDGKKSKDTPQGLLGRCMNESDKLLRTQTSDEKTEGHLRRARDLISALNLLAERTGTDVSKTVADLNAKAADLPAALKYLNHPITKALGVREIKVQQIEYQLRKKLSFWRGSGSISWLMNQNGWESEDILEYLQVHSDALSDENKAALKDAVRYHVDVVSDLERGLG
jgi:hypothetical protein